MSKYTWVYFLMFLLILLFVLLFFGGAVPRLPNTDPAEEENAFTGQTSVGAHPETILIVDPSAARGAGLILLSVPEQGQPHALYITNPAKIDGRLAAASPASAFEILSGYFHVDHYVAVDLQVFDELAVEAKLDTLPHEDLTPLTLLAFLLREAGSIGLGTMDALRSFLAGVDTNLSPQSALSLATRLNRLMPGGVIVHTSASEYSHALEALRERG